MVRFLTKKSTGLAWDQEAEKALGQVPVFVRKLARSKVESLVRDRGGSRVRVDDFVKAREIFRKKAGVGSLDELKGKVPEKNEPGVSMAQISACHNELSGCPWPLINTADWVEAVENRIREKGFSERLRKRIKDDKILFHNKIKIAVSGCPNGCSRPQIADFGLVGCVAPVFDLAGCTDCGLCADACPDKALVMDGGRPARNPEACQGCLSCSKACTAGCVTVEDAGVRLLAGGRLGRHPRLARRVGVFQEKEPVLDVIEKALSGYLDQDQENGRFADYLNARFEEESP